MRQFELTAPCNFAVEAVLAREIKALGYEISKTEDGRVNFITDAMGICKANLWLRTAERILIKVGEFEAYSYEELFQNVKKLDWASYIPKNAEFPIAKASSVKSKLFSPSDIQSITKKAIVEKMKETYKLDWFAESGAKYPIIVLIHKDRVMIYLDTTGNALHKRGYRAASNEAPIKETLAATMVQLTPWREDRLMVDPFCGSGTILIEAALIGLNKAPGIHRKFISETWSLIPQGMWEDARLEAETAEKKDIRLNLQGYDVDENVLKIARINAKLAGVEEHIHFQQRSVSDMSSNDKYGFIVTNPPYGERLQDIDSVKFLYKEMGKVFTKLDTWSFYVITSHEEFEKYYGKHADKKRKLYNGMIKADYYQYYGPKPPRREVKQDEQN